MYILYVCRMWVQTMRHGIIDICMSHNKVAANLLRMYINIMPLAWTLLLDFECLPPANLSLFHSNEEGSLL